MFFYQSVVREQFFRRVVFRSIKITVKIFDQLKLLAEVLTNVFRYTGSVLIFGTNQTFMEP